MSMKMKNVSRKNTKNYHDKQKICTKKQKQISTKKTLAWKAQRIRTKNKKISTKQTENLSSKNAKY